MAEVAEAELSHYSQQDEVMTVACPPPPPLTIILLPPPCSCRRSSMVAVVAGDGVGTGWTVAAPLDVNGLLIATHRTKYT